MKSSISWDIATCSPFKVNRRFGETCRFRLQGRGISRARNQRESRCKAEQRRTLKLVSSSACSSTLMTEATCSSEISTVSQQTTRRYIPEDRTLLRITWMPTTAPVNKPRSIGGPEKAPPPPESYTLLTARFRISEGMSSVPRSAVSNLLVTSSVLQINAKLYLIRTQIKESHWLTRTDLVSDVVM
jgi:hypothetical protein